MQQANKANISAIVLAAGCSTRMGQIKQLLPLGQSTLLQQTLENLRSTSASEIILVLGAAAEVIQSQLPATLLSSVVMIHNPNYAQGMATSLQAGLKAVHPESRAALVVLADQPFIRPDTFDVVMNEYRRTQARIILPIHQGQRGNPVLFDRSLFGEAKSLEGDTGFRAILGNHLEAIVKVEVEDSGILRDIDTPADYARFGA